LLGVVLVLAGCVAAGVGEAAPVTERISVTDYGGASNGASWGVVLSDDARYAAFYSGGSNIVPGDENDTFDIFVRDRLFGTVELISRSSAGVLGNNHSMYPAINTTGRYVAFCSMADNLVANDENEFMDVFVRDLETDLTLLVSVSPTGPANEKSTACAISADGQLVAFQSEATNLVSGETFGWPGIYLADLSAPTPSVTAVSLARDGGPPDGTSIQPSMTPDGRYVAFASVASDIVSGDTNGFSDVFLRDVIAPTTVRVSVADVTGQQGNSSALGQPAVTPDGRYVAFASYASNLVGGDVNQKCDVFLRDRTLGRTELISVSTGGGQGNDDSGGESWMVAVSSDGRYVAFASLASDLVAGDTNESWDVFVRDRTAGTTTRVSVSTAGEEGNGDAGFYSVSLSADGLTSAFDSYADNLVLLDTNGGPDVFVRGEALAPQPPMLVINGDAEYTTSPEVTLSIDPGDYPELRFKNSDGGWITWEAASWERAWTLSAGDGTKRVYIQGRNGLDLSVENYGEIELDTSAPAGASITIKDGDAETISRVVPLTLTASGATQMRFRNETTEWSTWEEFATTKTWKLSAARTTKTVGFQVRDAAGNTSPEVTDTIELITFTDVPEDYWAFDWIMACVDAAIVQGFPEGDYKPTMAVTRGQMAVFMARSLAEGDDSVPPGPLDPSFSDVSDDYWAYDYIEYVVERDVVGGYPEGDYKPEAEVSRAQMAVFVARAMAGGEAGLAGYVPPTEPTFPDVLTDHWAYIYVEYVVAQNITQGYPYPDPENPGEDYYRYEPDWAVGRDQMAVYVARAFGLLD
jgi:Tol biopolymer transport system component